MTVHHQITDADSLARLGNLVDWLDARVEQLARDEQHERAIGHHGHAVEIGVDRRAAEAVAARVRDRLVAASGLTTSDVAVDPPRLADVLRRLPDEKFAAIAPPGVEWAAAENVRPRRWDADLPPLPIVEARTSPLLWLLGEAVYWAGVAIRVARGLVDVVRGRR